MAYKIDTKIGGSVSKFPATKWSAIVASKRRRPKGEKTWLRSHNKAQYLKNGTWIDDHEFYYEEDPTAKVIFK